MLHVEDSSAEEHPRVVADQGRGDEIENRPRGRCELFEASEREQTTEEAEEQQ